MLGVNTKKITFDCANVPRSQEPGLRRQVSQDETTKPEDLDVDTKLAALAKEL